MKYLIPDSFAGLEIVTTGTYVAGNWPVLRFPGGGEIAVEPHLLKHFDEVKPALAEPPNGSIWLHEIELDGWTKRVVWQRDDERANVNGCDGNWFPTLGNVEQMWPTLSTLPGTWTELKPSAERAAEANQDSDGDGETPKPVCTSSCDNEAQDPWCPIHGNKRIEVPPARAQGGYLPGGVMYSTGGDSGTEAHAEATGPIVITSSQQPAPAHIVQAVQDEIAAAHKLRRGTAYGAA